MNNFVEITSRIGRMYQDFLISGKGSGDIIEEIDKLSAELRKNGCVNSIFFETLLKQGFMFDMINYNKVAPSASQKSYVYVLHAEDSGLTKIGFSRRVNKRISEISRMSGGKLSLIAKIPADRELETKLHQKYYNYRSHGEWFSLNRCHLKELKEMPGNELK
ncbi:GIY-YIG nuclease family protein [Escherichia coli]|uniref:GIY-YIG nuclease family protein n=1 Tax=Escherichia coli TaxID=562 RepID=UPI0005A80FC1|nr:GIY-YIG nuclease family protein [Escherichia coli]EFK4321907.1 GIY-YIG nuclease family protein [Escherichia coli]EHI0158306.1 GIY-YIG nuclease family protein [Escherichia coli]EHP6574756.1 GIY-YIG nuclease family protein [Escherichia coli]ELK0416870.1 GIY-YIG nuclease family protein [Escherichia coli]ELW6904034.1 GIY-YIG nuclease family protein [Escherichia coli]